MARKQNKVQQPNYFATSYRIANEAFERVRYTAKKSSPEYTQAFSDALRAWEDLTASSPSTAREMCEAYCSFERASFIAPWGSEYAINSGTLRDVAVQLWMAERE